MKLTAVGTKFGVVWNHLPDSPATTPTTFNELYLTRLRTGDHDIAQHFYQYSRRVLRSLLWGKVAPERSEDMVQDAISAAMEKIMKGEPRDASRLPAYVRAIGSNMAKQSLRPSVQRNFVDLDFNLISDTADSPERRVLAGETADAVKRILLTLPKRDREILLDTFFHQSARDEVCRKHNVTRTQLRLILFHARGRFQKLWLKQ